MTGPDASKLVGVSTITVYRYETKDRQLPVPIAKKFGELYGVPWETFYDD